MAYVSTDSSRQAQVRLKFFGTPALWLGEHRHELDRHLAALFLLLATEGPTPRSVAAQRLWPEVEMANSRNSLRQRLHRVRQWDSSIIVGQAVLSLQESVVTDLSVSAPPESSTYGPEFHGLLSGLDFSGSPQLLAWLETMRDQWRRRRMAWLDEEATRRQMQGQMPEALACLMALMTLDPLCELYSRRAMRLHYLQGNGTAALQIYDRLNTVLQEELGKPPDPETRRLAHVVMESLQDSPTLGELPVALERPPRLIGRDRELAWAASCWSSGVRIFLTGEAGIGKSRFIEALARIHQATIVTSRPSDHGVPFALIARLVPKLMEHAPMPAEWIADALAPFELEATQQSQAKSKWQEIRRALSAWLLVPALKTRPVCIDDLHFADAASLEVLSALALESTGPAWLLACRTTEVPEQLSPIRLAVQEGDGFAGLNLPPLDALSTARLIESLKIDACRDDSWMLPMFRRTGGRPLFILETVRHVLEQKMSLPQFEAHVAVAPSLQLVLQTRLSKLTPEALRLARVFAIADADFQTDMATRLLSCSIVDLIGPMVELERAQIIRERGFAHDLIQAAILQAIPPLIGEALHAEVAAWLTERQAPWSRIGRHWEAAGHWAQAGLVLGRAGDLAVNANRVHEGESLWRRSLEACRRADDCDGMVDALSALVRLALIRASLEDAQVLCEQLQSIAKTDRNRRYALHLLADTALRAQNFEAAARYSTELLEIAEAVNNDEAAFNARRKLAGALANLNRGEEALSTHAAMRDYVKGREHHQSVRVFFCDEGVVQELAGDSRQAEISLRTAIRLNLEHQDHLLVRRAWVNLASNLWRRGMTSQALEAARQAHALAEQLELEPQQALPDAADRLAILRDAAELPEAWQLLQTLSPLIEDVPSNALMATVRTHIAKTWLHMGWLDRALHILTADQPHRVSALASSHRILAMAEISRWHGTSLIQSSGLQSCDVGSGHWLAETLRVLAAVPLQGTMFDAQVLQARAGQAESRGLHGIALHAKLLALETDEQPIRSKQAEMEALLSMANTLDPYLLYKPEMWLRCALLLVRTKRETLQFHHHDSGAQDASRIAQSSMAVRALHCACDWIQRAAVSLPSADRDRFLQRNPVNRVVLALRRQVNELAS